MVECLKYLDKFLKFLKTDRNTFFTYILTLLSIYFVVDRLVEILFLIFTGVSVSYWGPFMYTFALACPVFAFLFCYGSKFVTSNKKKEMFFDLYVIALYIIGISMVVQWVNALIWFGLLSLPNYSVLATQFPELFKPALTAISLFIPLSTAPIIFSFLYKGVNDTRLWQESIWDYGGIKLSKVTTGTGPYACEMFICMDKETGRKAIIPEESRFNQFLVVGPSGSGKTSLVFEPMMARDIDKKFFFKNIAKEMGFTALKTGIATLNCPYHNDYINENFSLTMLTPNSSKLSLYKAFMKKMIIGEVDGKFVYKDLGLTSISPDYESISHIIEVAKCYHMPYNLVDPNNADSKGLNPFVYRNASQTADVINYVIRSMYQSTADNIQKVTVENNTFQAVENVCILLRAAFPLFHGGDKDYLPTLEDILAIFTNFDLAQKYCEKLEEDEELATEYASTIHYFKRYFYPNAPRRAETEKDVQYAISVIDELLKYPGVRNILCNRTENINYDDALANGEITLVCTRRGDLGSSVHKSFGLFFILLMQNAVLRRPGNENTRIPHFLYIDEFPEFLSPATEAIFTLYRKYKVGTTISSQTLAQLGEADAKYRQTIVSNCINKLVFGNNSIEENDWWSKEFGNIRHWKFTNNYDTEKGKYDPKLGNISWDWKSKFAADKVRSLGFKSCLFKWKSNKGTIDLCDGKLDFMDAKYKEPKTEKNFNFEKFTTGIAEDPYANKKKTKYTSDDFTFDDNPIQTDTSDANFLFNNEDAISFEFKRKK